MTEMGKQIYAWTKMDKFGENRKRWKDDYFFVEPKKFEIVLDKYGALSMYIGNNVYLKQYPKRRYPPNYNRDCWALDYATTKQKAKFISVEKLKLL